MSAIEKLLNYIEEQPSCADSVCIYLAKEANQELLRLKRDDYEVRVVPRTNSSAYPKLYMEGPAERALTNALMVCHSIQSEITKKGILTSDHPFRKEIRDAITSLHYGILDFYKGPVPPEVTAEAIVE